MKDYALWAAIGDAGCAIASTILLVKGAAPYPHEKQSWGGQTEPEIAHQTATRRKTQAGMVSAAITAALAVMAAFLGYLS